MSLFKTLFRTVVPTAIGFWTGNPWWVGLSSFGATKVTGGKWGESLLSGVMSGLGAYAGGEFGKSSLMKSAIGSHISRAATSTLGQFAWEGIGAGTGAFLSHRAIEKKRRALKALKNIDDNSKPDNSGLKKAPEYPYRDFKELMQDYKKRVDKSNIDLSTEPAARPLEPILKAPGGIANLNPEEKNPNNIPQYHNPAWGAVDPPWAHRLHAPVNENNYGKRWGPIPKRARISPNAPGELFIA
ncbi:MAG: hypothetical protein LBJ80_00090 [Rickettsiales bacterium]|jgi:hypothetical protein|nr:hypothetical protein [Rickettsiales bacterium]